MKQEELSVSAQMKTKEFTGDDVIQILATEYAKGYAAAQEESGALLNEMAKTLIWAREKLMVYRANTTGEYSGGMEYTQLIKFIDEALEKHRAK